MNISNDLIWYYTIAKLYSNIIIYNSVLFIFGKQGNKLKRHVKISVWKERRS